MVQLKSSSPLSDIPWPWASRNSLTERAGHGLNTQGSPFKMTRGRIHNLKLFSFLSSTLLGGHAPLMVQWIHFVYFLIQRSWKPTSFCADRLTRSCSGGITSNVSDEWGETTMMDWGQCCSRSSARASPFRPGWKRKTSWRYICTPETRGNSGSISIAVQVAGSYVGGSVRPKSEGVFEGPTYPVHLREAVLLSVVSF